MDALAGLERRVTNELNAFKAQVDAAFAGVNTALDNIQQDEANLNQQIQDLKAQLADAPLTPAAQALLDSIATEAQAMVNRSQTIAAAVPDVPPAAPPA